MLLDLLKISLTSKRSFRALRSVTMALSSTPGQREYVHNNATERSANESLDLRSEKFGLSGWMWILSLIIAGIGLVGNIMVLWLLGFRIRRNPFSTYILNLAWADTLFLCLSFVSSLHEVMPFFNDATLFKGVAFVTYAFYTVGLSLLAVISTERCLSVLFPIWYRCHRPKLTSAAVCVVLWALIGLNCVASSVICLYLCINHLCNYFFIFEFTWFIFFTCVLCGSSLTLLLKVQCSSQRRQPPRLYLLILLTVLVFLLCGLPMEIQDFIGHYKIRFMPLWLPWLLTSINSSANPFIYFFVGSKRHKIREPLRVVLQRAMGGEQELESGTRDTPHTNITETSF
ncbi:mas-related G-protein coupled receptor member X1-like [Notamacropus eugenii]|uniref:mas-related G-protein coupled receptor member X1-like n=1 Tax=Notamacropus eugenii TaxID=9315 RepID=UPI003B6852D5